MAKVLRKPMSLILSRRRVLAGLFAAPAIIKIAPLMRIKPLPVSPWVEIDLLGDRVWVEDFTQYGPSFSYEQWRALNVAAPVAYPLRYRLDL